MLFHVTTFATIVATFGLVAADPKSSKLWISWDAAPENSIGKRDQAEFGQIGSSVITYVAENFAKRNLGLVDASADLKPISNGDVHVGDPLAAYFARIDEYKSLAGEPDTNVDRFKRTPGDNVNCSSVAEVTKRLEIICHWATHMWGRHYPTGAKVYLNQAAYAVVPKNGRFISSESKFDGDTGHIVTTVKAGASEKCTGEVQVHGDWTVMTSISPAKGKDCTTEQSEQNLEEALRACIKESESRCAVSYCCRLRDENGWTGDVRLQRNDVTFHNIKDIKCAY
ncbi:hypothetical protein OXX69_002147 [Metschnikowia pulcherrima]